MKTITESYLIECLSFTDAEARTFELLHEGLLEFTIVSIAKTPVSDIFYDESAEKWWNAKTTFVSIDDTGKGVREKKIINQMYVQADSLVDAHATLQEKLKTMLVPYEVEGIRLTPLLEVYKQKTEAPPRATE